MTIKNISIVTTDKGFIYKKYEVVFKGKSDIIYYSQDDWGIRFESYNGNYTEKEFEEIKEKLFDDAYYNLNFSKF
jgi:hypothetical protein